VIPHGHKDLSGVGRIHDHVSHSGGLIGEEQPVPGAPSVSGTVKASLGVGRPRIADGTGIDYIRIHRVNDDTVNVPGQFKTHALPGTAAVQAPVYSVTAGDAVARIALTGACPDNVRALRINCQRTYGGHFLVIKNRGEGGARIYCFPEPSGSRAHVKHILIPRVNGKGSNPAAHAARTDVPGFDAVKH